MRGEVEESEGVRDFVLEIERDSEREQWRETSLGEHDQLKCAGI